jgi:hypothetical protein
MIGANEMADLRARMLLSAEAAYRLANASQPFVLYEQHEYEEIVAALLANKTDTRRVLAELEIFRSMFQTKLTTLFGDDTGAKDVGHTPTVAGVPESKDEPSSPPAQHDNAGATSGVPVCGVPKRRRGRPKSRPDTAGVPDAPESVE